MADYGKRTKTDSPLRILKFSAMGRAFRDQPTGYREGASGSGLSLGDSVQPDREWAMRLPAARHWETYRRESCVRPSLTVTVGMLSGRAMQGRNVVRIGGSA
ncbi:MAG: hypothetical protein U0670_10975 [Anaerolineae bacterium]